MDSILNHMKEGATRTVSRIVDITNAGYTISVSQKHSLKETDRKAHSVGSGGKRRRYPLDAEESPKTGPHVVLDDSTIITPDLRSLPASCPPSDLDLSGNEDDDLSALSPDKCGKIVDCLFGEIDVRVLTPPAKRVRFSHTDDIDVSELVCSSIR